jgi:bifunctional oligoribonuclease and PAP phosphatase NrnA
MSIAQQQAGAGEPAWESSTTVEELARWLRQRKRIVILTHVKPDGDAVGSTMAVARALNMQKGAPSEPGWPRATPWYWGPLPDWMKDVAGETPYRFISEADRADHDPAPEPDAVVILDTGAWSQLHEVREWLLERHDAAAIVDHHRQGDADVAPRRLIMTQAAAACEPAAELCRLILGLERIEDLPVEIATPLYLGICTDTGWFRHSNVTPEVMRLAASLLETGVNHSDLFETVAQQDRLSRLRLMTRALESLEMHNDNRVAIMTLRLSDFHDAHAAPIDSGGFSDLAMGVGSVDVCVVLTEAYVHEGEGGNITKVSLRSKNRPGSPDVNEVARKLGGGGHMRAAGAKVSADLETTRQMLLEALK